MVVIVLQYAIKLHDIYYVLMYECDVIYIKNNKLTVMNDDGKTK